MKRIERISIARVFSDLIKADRIVNIGEMEYWDKICTKYSITRELEVEAQTITFADALNNIHLSQEADIRKDFLADCYAMTVSDGFCAHSEALIMIALALALDDDLPYSVETISIPRANFNIDLATALYIEDIYDPDTNAAIEKWYRVIFKELQLVGFHFVYLPHIITHYRDTDPKLFRSILSFLAPAMTAEGIEHTYSSLMKMTTGTFCRDLLCNRLGITALRNTPPSLLIKIGNSFVGEAAYANYLRIEVDKDILAIVQSFIDRFCAMLSSDIYVVKSSEERDNQFHFHGFYKQLLDIFLIRKNIRSSVLLNPYKEDIYFPEIDTKLTGIHRREKALYALLLCQGSEGLNFTTPGSATGVEKYNRRLKKIQQRYSTIYEMFGGEKGSAPDLTIPEIRRPIFSCLRRSLKKLRALYNPDDYNITKSSDGLFCVHLDPELIFVNQLHQNEPVPLHESILYHNWLKS